MNLKNNNGERAQLFRQAVESDLMAAEKRRKQYNNKRLFKPFLIGLQVWKRNVRVKMFADWPVHDCETDYDDLDQICYLFGEWPKGRNCSLKFLKGMGQTGQTAKEKKGTK